EWIRDRRVEDAELRIDRHRFPDAAAVSLTADPGGPRDIPALIFFVLRNRIEVPENFSGFRIDGEHVTAGNMAFAAGAANVEHAVVVLRRRREPVAKCDRRAHFWIPHL